MREFCKLAAPALKIIGLVLATLVVCQLAGIFIRWNPFRGVTVPALPSLAAGTNSMAGSSHGINLPASATIRGTNLTQLPPATNLPPSVTIANANSILPPGPVPAGTNSMAKGVSISTNTNAETNAVAHQQIKLAGVASSTLSISPDKATHQVVSTNSAGSNVTNATVVPAMAGVNFNPFEPPGKSGGDLPPAIQAQISRITDSEILGPVMRPLPMALLGIAGDVAFLRTAGGQTGLVKEGDSLGDLKLLQIGINRVLIEQAGQKKELMIFSGYGGESLLPKQKDNPDENNHP